MGDFEKEYLFEAFESNWIAPLGPMVDGFEKEMVEYLTDGTGKIEGKECHPGW